VPLPSPLYQRWFSVYNQQKPNVRISYQSIGSGAGVEQFMGLRLCSQRCGNYG